jgi:hypothetical protein
MYPERRGQPHNYHIDWRVAALDGVGLILFFVPGVVAFAVDFYTGAIYLPLAQSYPGYGASPQQPSADLRHQLSDVSGKQHQPTWREVGLKRVAISPEQLQPRQIEQVVSHHVGKSVSLADDQTRMSALPQIDQFGEQIERHQSNPHFGVAARSINRAGA